MATFNVVYNWYLIISAFLLTCVVYFITIRLNIAVSAKKASTISGLLAILSSGLTFLAVKYGNPDGLYTKAMSYMHFDSWLSVPIIGLSAVPLIMLILILAGFQGQDRRSTSENSGHLSFKLLRPYLNWKYFVLIALTFVLGHYGLGIPERIMAIYTFLFFITFPALQWMRQDTVKLSELNFDNTQKDIKEEREKVLAMVENGKVSADDASLLIGALQTNSLPKPQRQKGILGGWRIMTVGALLCLLAGGILPWVYFPTRVADADSETIIALKLLKETFADIHGMPSDFAFLFLVHLKKINTALFIVLTLSVPIVFFGLGKWINPRISITITAILLISAIVSLLFSYGRPLVPSFGVYTTFAGLLLMAWAIIEAWKDERI